MATHLLRAGPWKVALHSVGHCKLQQSAHLVNFSAPSLQCPHLEGCQAHC